MLNQRKTITLRTSITGLVLTALFAALISAGAFITVPIGPVPFVLQNFFTLLSGLVLGPFLGAMAVALFIVAGAIGVPVFSNNGSPMGIARLIGPTGGFYLGYFLGAIVAGLVIGFPRQGEKIKVWRLALAVVLGGLTVYIPGLIRLKFFLETWPKTFAAGFFPFLIGDAIKGVVAALIAPRLRRAAARQVTGSR
ncbi:MAG: biotin transporter BioY [Treponema sp.]|nr:biotin transporter BioY [Treponema sp.]